MALVVENEGPVRLIRFGGGLTGFLKANPARAVSPLIES
jgi:hypothetical protein